jgi:hypothetical protein
MNPVKVPQTTCPLCTSTSSSNKYIASKDSAYWFKCKACGFVFADRNRFHSPYGRADYYKGYNWPDRQERLALTIDRDRLQAVRKLGFVAGKWFDIGFGDGETLQLAASQGYSVGGVEESPIALERIKRILPEGHWISAKEYFESPPQNQYDLLSMYHVLEHIVDFKLALRMAVNSLAVGGLLVVEVPYFFCIQALIAPSQWKWTIEHHINFFTKENLISLFENFGCRFLAYEFRFDICAGSTETISKKIKLRLKRILDKIGFGQTLTVYGQKKPPSM